jgi:hypothetical protein
MLLIGSTVYLVNQLFFKRTGESKYNNRENGSRDGCSGTCRRLPSMTSLSSMLAHTSGTHCMRYLISTNLRRTIRYRLLHKLFLTTSWSSSQLQATGSAASARFVDLRNIRIAPTTRITSLLRPPGQGNDAVIGFFLMYAGPTDVNGNPLNAFPAGCGFEALIAGLAAYRPPPQLFRGLPWRPTDPRRQGRAWLLD